MHLIQEEIGIPKIEPQKLGDFLTVFTISPLPSGYGMTLGNALRRVLLSSLPGAAVTGIKIKGIPHEYTAIEGVKDSIFDIILNLKQLHLKKTTKEPSTLTLNVNRVGVVKARDIRPAADIEILNPDLYLTSIDSKKNKLEMEIRVEKGVGYLPIHLRKGEDDPEIITLDAVFSPVKKIRYDVEATRVGQMTNLDKLIIEIETNGSISPEDALKFSADILKSYFGLFDISPVPVEADFMSDFKKIAEKAAEEESRKPKPEAYTPIEILGLSPRTLNSLINGGIGSIEQLTKCTEAKLNNLRGFGKKALTEVKTALTGRNFTLAEE